MKRKFTFLATLVLSLFAATSAMADQTLLAGTGASTVTPVAGTKYVIQGNGQASQITWLYDNNGTFAATRNDAGVPTGTDALKYVWTFEVLTEGDTKTYAAKNDITGNYIFIEGTSNGGNVKMQSDPFYFTIENNETEVAFKNASGQYIDMGYSGVGPVTWGGGVTGSRRLVLYEAVFETKTDLEIAMGLLNDCYGKYSYFNNEPFPLDKGTEIGQYNYSDELKNEMLGYLATALNILQEKEEATVEEIEALIQNLENTNTALLNTFVRLTIADGNYRLVSAMEWTQTETVATGEFDEETGEEVTETVTTHPTKAMYATLEGNAKWATIDNTDCRYLWNITNLPTNSDSVLVKLMNIATDGIVATCSVSTQATLTADSETKMYFEFIERRADGSIVVAMKPSDGGVQAFMHCGGHASGAGKSGNIVGWGSGAGASQWILVPASNKEVNTLVEAYAPIKNHELLVSMFQEAITEAEAAIADAKDLKFVTERSEGLITDTLQFSSPYTDPTEGSFGKNGGVLNPVGGDFWHSTWQGGDVPAHSHFFQVAFTEPIENTIQCYMIRRGVQNDHITKLGVFGTNDESVVSKEVSEGEWSNLTEDGWNNLGTFNLSANAVSEGRTYSANGITLPEGGYKYFRFYIDGTTNNRGYGHFYYFQLYNLFIKGYSRWEKMGQAATDIEKALANAKAVDQETMVIDDYNHLRDTLDAFKALIVDPTALANAINANKNVTELVAVGDAPGFWSADSEVGALATTLEEATAYLYGGAYTQEQVEAYTEAIQTGASDIFAAANPVEEGKWYAIKYDSEANFDAHGWSKDGATKPTFGDSLFDYYVSPAAVVTTTTVNAENQEVETKELVATEELDEVTLGNQLHFVDWNDVNSVDVVAFRFVNQGDSAYAIQHKSGLYLGGNQRSTCLTLGLVPALFNVRAVGYGKVVIEARNLKGQRYYADAPVFLHAARANNDLVTWDNDNVASSSALYIEPIDVDGFDEGEEIAESVIMPALPNSMSFKCYPVGFSVSEDSDAKIYAYQGAIREGAQAHYVFNEVEAAAPGQPVLLVVGDPADLDTTIPAEDYEEIGITLGTSFAVDPLTEGGVHGTYAYEWVDKGTVVVGGGIIAQPGNALVLAEGEENTDCTRDVSANTGYIVYGENVLQDADKDDYDLVFTAGWPVKKGDVNLDTVVDIADVVTVLNAMAGQAVAGDANVNGDTDPATGLPVVDIADVVTVLNIMAGVK